MIEDIGYIIDLINQVSILLFELFHGLIKVLEVSQKFFLILRPLDLTIKHLSKYCNPYLNRSRK
jgi:hypothetical protein